MSPAAALLFAVLSEQGVDIFVALAQAADPVGLT